MAETYSREVYSTHCMLPAELIRYAIDKGDVDIADVGLARSIL